MKRTRGRPSVYTPELAKHICERLSTGESLRAICRDEGMPAPATVRDWARDDLHGFSAQYAEARDHGLDAMADEVLEIADDNSSDKWLDQDGVEHVNNEVINRSRLRVDTRKWYLSKLAPKRYGDRVDVNAEVKTNAQQVDLLELARDIAFVLALAGERLEAQQPRLIEAST